MPKRSAQKERFWRRMLRRQEKSGLSVRQFCLEQQLSEASFYSWKRTIADRDRRGQRAATVDVQTGARPKGAATSKGERFGSTLTQNQPGAAGKQADAAALFVPLKLSAAASSVIEVVHPRGHLVRVPAVFDAHGLRQLLDILDQPGDGSSC